MKTFTNGELAEMQTVLQEIADTSENNLQAAERSYQVVQRYLQKLKEFILSRGFKDKAEEIHFFKYLKPLYLKQLIYFKEVFHLEAGLPLADEHLVQQYYKQFTERINGFFERNHRFYIYHRTGKTDQDEVFFTRGANHGTLLPEYILDIDPEFSTLYSFKLAKILAYEKLNAYIRHAIHQQVNGSSQTGASELAQVSLPWTDKKTGLIEILYALQSMGSLNNSKAELRQIARLFEVAFHIDLGNYSRAFQEIRLRKKGRAQFLDRMKEMLIKRMDEADEYF